MASFISDLVSKFINTDIIPKVVSHTLSLKENGSSEQEIIAEICGMQDLKILKAPKESKEMKESKAKIPKASPKNVSIEEYMKDYENEDEKVCIYIGNRGDNKDKVCCAPLKEGTYTENDQRTYRCAKHKDSMTKDIASLIKAKKNSPNVSDHITKVRDTLPAGTPKVFADKKISMSDGLTSSKESSKSSSGTTMTSGTTSNLLKDRLAKFIKKPAAKEAEPATPEKEVEPVEPSSDKEATPEKEAEPAEPVEPSSDKEATPEKEADPVEPAEPTEDDQKSSSSSSAERTPPPAPPHTASLQTKSLKLPKKKEAELTETTKPMTLEDFEARIPKEKDEDGEMNNVYVTPSLPAAAEKYIWMLISETDVLVLEVNSDGALESCYGRYKSSKKIDKDSTLKISDGWKDLLEPLTGVHKEYVTGMDLKIKTF